MPLNHSQATATVTVAGLALFRRIGRGRAKQCEVGILQCDNHTLELRIEEILLEADGITPQRSRIIVPEFRTDKDIYIKVHDPLDAGVTAYRPGRRQGGSNKGQKPDDVEDFGLIVDFTSPNPKIQIYAGSSSLKYTLRTERSTPQRSPRITSLAS